MDEQLAQIYGTGQTDAGEDLEKNAAAELLVKLAAEQGLELESFSDEQIAGMVAELYKTAEEEPAKEEPKKEEPPKEEKKETPEEKHEGGESSSESAEKEAQAKFAEADFLGRVMAHAYVQEKASIEKSAGKVGDAVAAVRKLPAFLKNKGVAAGKAATGAGKSVGEKAKEVAGKAGAAVKAHPFRTAGGAAAAGALAGGAAMHKKKEGSALDELASQRAFELAKEAGYVDEQGNLLVPEKQEKQASALELAVEQRALEMLEAQGLPVEWNK